MSIAQLGDKAVLTVNKENRDWGYNPAPDGTIVELSGYGETIYTRRQSFGKKPGVYESHMWPNVRLPNGKEIGIHESNLKFLDDKKLSWDAGKFLRDLPETAFWEYDEVKYVGGREYGNDYRYVFTVHYGNFGKFCDDGVTPLPVYDLSPTLSGGSYSCFRENEIELVARGDIWKYYHGEPLSFKTLQAEADFFSMLGHTDEVRNPRCDLYRWDRHEGVESALAGLIDCLSGHQYWFGGSGCSAVRFRDRDLGERVRAEFLREFSK